MLRDLTLGSRLTLVGGKGGVGKTTVAAALAIEVADGGEPVLAVSVDPAHSLGDALDIELGPDPRPVSRVPRLSALEVDASVEQARFSERHGGTLASLIERGTYLEPSDLSAASDLTLPGMDEIAALLRLVQLLSDPTRRIIVDTAPTGHTLRLLELPRVGLTWLAALEAMQAKQDAVLSALVGARAVDDATRLLAGLRSDLHGFETLLDDPIATRFVLVTTRESTVMAETIRYRERLEQLGVSVGGVVVNRDPPPYALDGRGPVVIHVPPLAEEPVGAEGLRRFSRSAERPVVPGSRGEGSDSVPSPSAPRGTWAVAGRVDGWIPFRPPADREIYLVAGKGGVGKSTVSAAIAIHLAAVAGRRVLLLSVDPAGSLSEILGEAVTGDPGPLPGLTSLHTRQLDAGGAWDDFRARHRGDVERLVRGMLPGGMSATLDQQVLQRVIDLAPTGVDELMALMEVIDLLGDREYDALVVDTAPTGHFLRLLELPELALGWTHSLLRLLLKYRSAVPIGEVGERVLNLSRELRALRGTLVDPARTWLGVVALPEALSVPETRRLIDRSAALGVAPAALIINRWSGAGAEGGATVAAADLRRLVSGVPVAAAPAMTRAPTGVSGLREFLSEWHLLPDDSTTVEPPP